MRACRPIWRSVLFVPVHVDKFVAAAHRREADAYILDLEDSVPQAEKLSARGRIQSAARTVVQGGAAVLVRVNAELEHLAADVEAAVDVQASAVMLPKANNPAQLKHLDQILATAECRGGIAQGSTQ